ncbi:FtsJ-like methyltransferase [Hokovirus HKV1]|uniref:FtsJ-like methyltransferase n=1 Tax=Hokovirus HKV1 TaxID=1977638 RepID=A0A1V0SGQ7_9VIRU|nr:FtsJ-like methyltransferase [Hokovirus HKV1]
MYTNNFYIDITNKNFDLEYIFDPKFNETNINNDENICPLEVSSYYKKEFINFMELDPLIPNYIPFFNGSQYLTTNTYFNDMYFKNYRDEIKIYPEKKIIINKDLHIDYKNITIYNFPALYNLLFFTICKITKIFDHDILLLCKTTAIYKAIFYYKKYSLYQTKIDKQIQMMIKTDNVKPEYLKNYPEELKDIKHVLLPEILDEQFIKNLKIKKYNTIVIDLPLLINSDYLLVANNASLQLLISTTLISLNNLNDNGNLVICYYAICNTLTLNIFIYLSSMFNKFYFANINELVNMKDYEIIIFENYTKNDKKINELNILNNMILKNDPSAGKNYKISSKQEAKAYDLDYDYNNNYNFLTNFINFKNNNLITKIYKRYKKYIIHKFEQKHTVLKKAIELYNNNTNKTAISYILELNKLKAINFTKKYDIKIVDWVNTDINVYFKKTLLKYYKNLELCDIFKLNHNKDTLVLTKIIDNIQNYNFSTWSILSENAYEITEKVDKDKFKMVELFFNNRQKDLNDYLYKNLKININKKKTSRAWLKMQELLIKTEFFKNIVSFNEKNNLKSIKTLHICEAPGNFINSCNFYIKSHTSMLYDWSAQSLQDSKIYDHYGFIKNNQKKWDFYNGGDITKYDNFMHYYNTYKNVDALISDCGTDWIIDSDNIFQKELSVYEILYGLLIPRLGGNFIMKTIASNYSPQFIYLVYIASIKFEHVYIFKSNNNFWSQEIYIVGINKYEINEEETKILFDIIQKLEKKEIWYPIKHISDDFCNRYDDIMKYILEQFKTTKILFTFLIDYEELFEKNRKYISNIVYKKNAKWLKKFMYHLKNSHTLYLKSRIDDKH